MLATIRNIIVSFTVGAAIGAGAMYFIPKLIPDKSLDAIKITQLAGEKITHRDYDFKGKTITFITESEGKGKIKTEIPKTLIPEARYWMTKLDGIEVSAFLLYQNKLLTPYYNLGYWHRFGSVCIGPGVVFSLPISYGSKLIDPRGSIGVKLGVIGWF
jgi:hypothetical protein